MMKPNQTMQHRSALTVSTLVLGALAAALLGAYSNIALSQTAASAAATSVAKQANAAVSATTATSDQAVTKLKRKAKGKAKAKTKTKPMASNQRMSAQEKTFAQADVDKTGKLTKKQAFNAKMYDVDRYFFDIDTDIDGYVTQAELTSWKASPVRTAPRPRGDRLDRFVTGDGARK